MRKEAKRQGITEREAEKYIAKTDKYRRAYYKYHTGREWEDPYNYDLCLNTEGLTYEQCARVIEYQVYERFGVPMP